MSQHLDSSNMGNDTTSGKPNMYLLEEFPEEAVRYCQGKFHAILPTDPEVQDWRNNAEAILVRETIISAQGIAAAHKLRAIGEQGTGIEESHTDYLCTNNWPRLLLLYLARVHA